MGAPKQKWTPEEEAALKAGVLKHGTGKWRTILSDTEFSLILKSRSNVDLKVIEYYSIQEIVALRDLLFEVLIACFGLILIVQSVTGQMEKHKRDSFMGFKEEG